MDVKPRLLRASRAIAMMQSPVVFPQGRRLKRATPHLPARAGRRAGHRTAQRQAPICKSPPGAASRTTRGIAPAPEATRHERQVIGAPVFWLAAARGLRS